MTTPTVELQISVNGAPFATGPVEALPSQTLDMRVNVSDGILSAVRYEIYDYPIGMPCPAGWTADTSTGAPSGEQIYFFAPSNVTSAPPTVTFPAAAPNNWGPVMLRAIGNGNPNRLNDDGTPNPAFSPGLTDTRTLAYILSPTLGMMGLARGITSQFDVLRLWVGTVMQSLRLLDNASSGGSFSAGGDISGSAIFQNVIAVHGASVPAAGALVTGNSLHVSGASALTYAALNLAGGAGWITGVLPTTNGGTGLSTVGSNGQVLTVVGGVPAWANPASTSFVPGGDIGGTSTVQSVLAIHGATVPIAGGLTTGNVLQVTGPSSLAYGALNLAGGAGFVTGTLPAANQAPQTMAGDVTGTTAASVVARVNGATVPAAGALVVGAVLQVLSASALAYGPINLGNPASVGGSLGVANGGTGLSALGAGNQLLGMNSAGTALAYFTTAGDLTLAAGAFTVVALQGNGVATTAPTSGQVLTWNSGTSKWTPTTPGGAGSVTGSGVWHSTAGTLDGAASKGTAGQFLLTNAGATDTPWTTISGDVSASTSTVGQLTVTALQGHAVLSTAPTAGQFLVESAGAAGWAPASITGDVTASTGTPGALTVIKLQGFAVATTTPTSGQVLTWNSGSSAWTPTNAGGTSVTGSGLLHSTAGTLDGAAYKGTAGQFLVTNNSSADTAWATISGDIAASTSTVGQLTVTGIRGNPVSITPATAGQFLIENAAATGSAWTSLAGDVTASTGTPGSLTVVALQSVSVATTTPTAGQVLTFLSGTGKWTPVTPGSAASVTGSGIWHSTSGTLDSAASKGTAGQALFTAAGATDTAWASISGDVSASTTTVGAFTVTGLQGRAVSATGATAGQFLVQNSSSSSWAPTTLSGDVTASTSTVGALTVVALQGFGVSTTAPTSGQALIWNSGSSKWTPTTISAGASVTGSGIWHSTAGTLDGAASKGTAGQFLLTNNASSDTAWATISGDISASTSTVGQLTVTALQTFGVATTTPTSGQALLWNAGTSKWTPTTITAGVSVTGSGVVHATAGVIDGAASKGTAGQALFTNAGSTDTAWASFAGDVSGSTGTPGSLTVIGLQGHGVLTGAPTAGQFLVEAAGAAGWGPVTLSGDVTGSTTTAGLLTVVALQGHGIDTTAPTAGQVLTWISGTSKWTPTTPAATAAVTGSGVWHSTAGVLDGAASKGTAGQFLLTNAGATDTAWASISGDVSASTGTPGALTVTALQGHNVASTAPSAGQFLVENAGATAWSPVTISGDVSASITTVGAFTVTKIQGTAVSATPPTTGQTLVYNGTNYAPATPSVSSRLRFQVGTGATTSSATVIPANAQIYSVFVTVDTPYSAGATLQLGNSGSAGLISSNTQVGGAPDIVGASAGQGFFMPCSIGWGASALAFLATIGGAPAAGQLHIDVTYGFPAA